MLVENILHRQDNNKKLIKGQSLNIRKLNFCNIFCLIFTILIFNNFAYGEKFPLDIKSTVVFLYAEKDAQFGPVGTGFLMGVDDLTKSLFTTYLVTAKHVLKDSTNYFQKIYVRINRKDSLAAYIRINLYRDGRKKNIFVNGDSTVDIAVIPFEPNPNTLDFKRLPTTFIPKNEDFFDLEITEGTNIFFTGLFTNYKGKKKNYPIIRFGKVALFTDEKINWDGTETNLYLIEANAFGGNSGSPVFFYDFLSGVKGQLGPSPKVLKLAGILKGHFNDYTEPVTKDGNIIPLSLYNNGIASVVPSYFLEEILFSGELKSLRGY